jgi:hypothetical protein
MLVCISSLSTTFGLFFQKISQDRGGICGGDTFEEKRCSFFYWFSGFSLITLISFALDLYSMARLGQSLVVPLLAGLEVAENQVFAPIVLGAPLNKKYDYSSAVIIVIGSLLTSLSGPKNGAAAPGQSGVVGLEARSRGPCHNVTTALFQSSPSSALAHERMFLENKHFMEGLFAEPLFLVYETFVCAGFIVCLVVMKCKPKAKNLFLYYGYAAGFLGGQQNLFLKGVGTMIGLAFQDRETSAAVFSNYLVWVFILFMLVLAPSQLAVINVGLLKFSITKFVPAYTVLYIIHGTSVGLFFYAEYEQLVDPSAIAGFICGLLLIMGSLGILGAKPDDATGTKNDLDSRTVMKIGADTNPLTFLLFAASRQITLARRAHGVAVSPTVLRVLGVNPTRVMVKRVISQQSTIRAMEGMVLASRKESLKRTQLKLGVETSTPAGKTAKISPQPSPVSHRANFGFEDSV